MMSADAGSASNRGVPVKGVTGVGSVEAFSAQRPTPSAGQHDALLYRTDREYVDGIVAFLEPALQTGGPAFVAVPGFKADLVREGLTSTLGSVSADNVQLADMMLLGRNPARIIPAIQEFLDGHPSRAVVKFVGEPIWAGRRPAELCEATRHEALLNTVFGGAPVDILCPYDLERLDRATIVDAKRTHPTVIDRAGRRRSETFASPATMYDPADPLPPAPPEAVVMPVEAGGLASLRRVVRDCALAFGLGQERASDLVLAANELATNTLMHTDRPGVLRIWSADGMVVCEVSDTGDLNDPLAGRRRPPDDAGRGRGLWMANVLCDLVQWRCSADGATVRLWVSLVSS
jgi:anti-sigma regulatory factor (Ser/Thr protein kinase)